MKHSYTATLLCLCTTLFTSCKDGDETSSMAIAENNPSEAVQQHLTQEKAKVLWEQKMTNNQQNMISIITDGMVNTSLLSTEQQNQLRSQLYGIILKYDQTKVTKLVEQCGLFLQQFKEWCLRLPYKQLELVVATIEKSGLTNFLKGCLIGPQSIEYDMSQELQKLQQEIGDDIKQELRKVWYQYEKNRMPILADCRSNPNTLKEIPQEFHQSIAAVSQEYIEGDNKCIKDLSEALQKPLQEKFKMVYNSNVKTGYNYKDDVMRTIKEIINNLSGSDEAYEVYQTSLDGYQQLADYYTSYLESLQDWCLSLPDNELKGLIALLETCAASTPNHNRVILEINCEKINIASTEPKEKTLLYMQIEAIKKMWELLTTYMRRQTILTQTPKEFQNALESKLDSYYTNSIQSKLKQWENELNKIQQ